MATDDQADAFYTDPANEGTSTAVRVREYLIGESLLWEAQIPDEVPETPAALTTSEVVTEIYAAHYSQLVRLAVMLVHDVDTAEEVVQDAFEAMQLARSRTLVGDKALSYLRQAIVNRSRSVLRHRNVEEPQRFKPAADEQSAEYAALTLIQRSAITSALRSLPMRQREAIVLRYYGDFSEADIAKAMGISRREVKRYTARAMATLKLMLEREDETNQPSVVSLPVSIYLAEEGIHEQVEAAVEEWLDKAGISIEEREQPIIGSWFRRMRATAKVALSSEATQEVARTAVHAADAHLILAQDASITAAFLSNLAPVIASLQPTKDAVLRVGALLIVKVDWAVQVIQLTAAQQAILDHQPQLTSAPHEIFAALQLPSAVPKHATSAGDSARP